MEICEVQQCPKPANLGGLCVFHRRKDIAGGLEYAPDGRIWDLCAKGHRWTEANTHMENNSNGGKRRRCKLCLADKAEAKRNEAPEVHPPQPVRLSDPTLRRAFDTFDTVQNDIEAKCKNDWARYTDYDAKHIPTDVEAAKLCSGCPMLEACANNAIATRPGWGVWGATVWAYGVPYDGDRSKLDDDD